MECTLNRQNCTLSYLCVPDPGRSAPKDVQASGAERGGDTTLAQSEIPGFSQGLVCRAAEAKMAAEDFGHLDEDT
jgi:hypothetical protein